MDRSRDGSLRSKRGSFKNSADLSDEPSRAISESQDSFLPIFSFPVPVPRTQRFSFPLQVLSPLLDLRLAGEGAVTSEVSTFFTVPKEKHVLFHLELMVNHGVGRIQLRL